MCQPQNNNTNTSTNNNYWKQFKICTAVLFIPRPYPSWYPQSNYHMLKSCGITSVCVVVVHIQYADFLFHLLSVFRYFLFIVSLYNYINSIVPRASVQNKVMQTECLSLSLLLCLLSLLYVLVLFTHVHAHTHTHKYLFICTPLLR